MTRTSPNFVPRLGYKHCCWCCRRKTTATTPAPATAAAFATTSRAPAPTPTRTPFPTGYGYCCRAATAAAVTATTPTPRLVIWAGILLAAVVQARYPNSTPTSACSASQQKATECMCMHLQISSLTALTSFYLPSRLRSVHDFLEPPPLLHCRGRGPPM